MQDRPSVAEWIKVERSPAFCTGYDVTKKIVE